MKRIKYWMVIAFAFFSFQNNAYAMFGMDAAAMIPYLVQIINQSIKQYTQLKQLYDTTSKYKDLLDRYHQGIDEALRLLEAQPVHDANILGQIRKLPAGHIKHGGVYGKIPNSPETSMLKLHDESIAESINMLSEIKEYTARQERNADLAMAYAKDASPKGAARVRSRPMPRSSTR